MHVGARIRGLKPTATIMPSPRAEQLPVLRCQGCRDTGEVAADTAAAVDGFFDRDTAADEPGAVLHQMQSHATAGAGFLEAGAIIGNPDDIAIIGSHDFDDNLSGFCMFYGIADAFLDNPIDMDFR